MSTFKVAVVSDIHFPDEHPVLWPAFKEWVKEHKPYKIMVLGDLNDLGMLSSYVQGADDPIFVLPTIQQTVRELNGLLKYVKEIEVDEGNHDERWAKALLKPHAQKLKGLKGLTLQDQMYAQGLNRRIKWGGESIKRPAVELGGCKVLARHGHKQASKWGVVHIAQKGLVEQPTRSSIVGHHHRAQLSCRTTVDGTIISIANPCMTGDHDYQTLPNWQRGFTVLEFFGGRTLGTCRSFTPQIIIADADGRFAYAGKVYGTRPSR